MYRAILECLSCEEIYRLYVKRKCIENAFIVGQMFGKQKIGVYKRKFKMNYTDHVIYHDRFSFALHTVSIKQLMYVFNLLILSFELPVSSWSMQKQHFRDCSFLKLYDIIIWNGHWKFSNGKSFVLIIKMTKWELFIAMHS